MTNQHKVATDALDTLGTLIDERAGRDAIHLAVEPVIAGNRLRPGERIRLIDGKAVTASIDESIGIVDPFLRGNIAAGDRFWLVVNPRTITSLRHVWSHPAFQEAGHSGVAYSPAEQWIRDFADRVSLHYDVLMEGADEWVRDKKRGGWGEYLCFGGLLEGESVPDEFWTHYEAVKGEKVAEEHRGSFFTCSC